MNFRKVVVTAFSLFVLFYSVRTGFAQPQKDASAVPGKYYLGDGLGVNNYLNLSPDGTFSFKWQGCMGTYDENEGPYALENGVVVLSPKKPNNRDGFRGTPTRFLPVAWGTRIYLVPEDQILDFVNEINQGGEPRKDPHGEFYLREGDESKQVEGFPMLPAPWQDFLLKAPLAGKVIKTEGKKVAILDLGSKDGLRVGMLLTARDPRDTRFTQIKVVSVEEGSARAEALYEDGKVFKGDTVSTRFH